MKLRAIRSLALFAGCVLFAGALCAAEPLPDASQVAYRGGSKPPAQPKVGDVTLTGTIQSMQTSGLTIKAGKTVKGKTAKSQKQWTVVGNENTEVTIEGTATLDYLHKGQLVEFTGQVVNDDHVEGKLKELTIVDKKTQSTSSTTKTGTKTRDHAADPGVGGGRIETPKSDDDADTLSVAEAPKTSTASSGKTPAKTTVVVAAGPKTTIVGKVVSREGNKLTITHGRHVVKIDLAELPAINVRLSDRMLAQTGAKVVVHGTGAESKTTNQVIAKTIVVTLAEPLTGKKTSSSSSIAKKPATGN